MKKKTHWIKSIISNLLFFALAFLAINWWQTKDHIRTSANLESIASQPLIQGEINTEIPWQSKTILYFFATWCGVCEFNYPVLNKIYEKKDIQVIGIALSSGEQSEVRKYLKEKDILFPVVYGNESIGQYYQVSGFPTFYFLDQNAKIISSSTGYTSEVGVYLRSL